MNESHKMYQEFLLIFCKNGKTDEIEVNTFKMSVSGVHNSLSHSFQDQKLKIAQRVIISRAPCHRILMLPQLKMIQNRLVI